MIKKFDNNKPDEIAATISDFQKLQHEVCSHVTKEMELLAKSIKSLKNNHPDRLHLVEARNFIAAQRFQKNVIPISESPARCPWIIWGSFQLSGQYQIFSGSLKPKVTGSNHSRIPKKEEDPVVRHVTLAALLIFSELMVGMEMGYARVWMDRFSALGIRSWGYFVSLLSNILYPFHWMMRNRRPEKPTEHDTPSAEASREGTGEASMSTVSNNDETIIGANPMTLLNMKPVYLPLPEEPEGSRDIVCRVGVRLPDGQRLQRKFLHADVIKLLWSFCSSQLDECERRLSTSLLRFHMPREC